MLILHAQNVTAQNEPRHAGEAVEPKLVRADGTADYVVWVGVNRHCIWMGDIRGHVRKKGASELLRLIASRMEEES
jgi:hypothetical protein